MNRILREIYLLIAIIITGGFTNAQENKTILICIDGCNSEIVEYAYAPVVKQLIANATYSTKVELRGNAYPTSGWASLLTGAYSSNHGVEKDSTWEGNNFEAYPLLFDRMKTETPDKKSTAIVSNSLLYEIVQSADYHELLNDDDAVENSIINQLRTDNETSLFFIELTGMFETGVTYGFGNSSIEYVKAFSNIDNRIGNILDALKYRTNYENENWRIIITSNHGGKMDGTYGGVTKNEILIPVIISGDNVDNRDMATGLSEAKPDKNNSLQINPESTSDYRYVMINKKGTKLNEMQDFSVEFRVYADVWTSDPSIIGDKDWDSGGNPGWTVCRRSSGFKFQLADDKRVRIDVNSSVVIEDGDWHHVAVTFDPQGMCNVYTDGELTGSMPQTYATSALFASPFNYLAIGNEGTLRYPNWKGIIDEVRIWDVAISGETVKEYYKKENIETLGHPNIASLLAYYKMDGTTDVEGSRIIDSGPYGYHGTLVKCDRVHVAPLKNTDIYPTIIDLLGGEVQNEWLLNGEIVENDIRFILNENAASAISAIGSHYPNPILSTQTLNVILPNEFKDLKNVELKVIDLNGVLHLNKRISLFGSETFQIQMNGLKTGNYIYSFRSGDKYLLGKFQVNE